MKKLLTGISAAALCALAGVFLWSLGAGWKAASEARAEKARLLGEYYAESVPSDELSPGGGAGSGEEPGSAAHDAGSDNDRGETNKNVYEVYQNGGFLAGFPELAEAARFAAGRERSEIYERGRLTCLWDNYPAFCVYAADGPDGSFEAFGSFPEALTHARQNGPFYIYYRKNSGLVWQNAVPLEGRAFVSAPEISQLPELPRGCEVTSLAMLLNFYGIDADKLELAGRIRKNDAVSADADGAEYRGDPNDGFVGDIYSSAGEGLGVYHGPVRELMSEYAPRAAMDLTGCDFEDLFCLLENGAPVWVICNSTYAPLPGSAFQTWKTRNGPIDITYYEHSVLVTGYDGQYVYFNDPLKIAVKAPRESFIAAWEQMGRQAVACAV